MDFLIRRPSPRENASLTIPIAAVRGKAFMHDTDDSTRGLLATNGFVGFITRQVTDAGPAISDFVVPTAINAIETVSKSGQAVSLEDALEVEAEGSEYLLASGASGYVSLNTAVGTGLSFKDGKFCVAATLGYTPYFKVAAHLTVQTAGNTTRILAVRI